MQILDNVSNLHASQMAEHMACSWRDEGMIIVNYSYTFFSTNNLPNTAQQGEKKRNCFSCIIYAIVQPVLYSQSTLCNFHISPRTASLGSCTIIRRFVFYCQLHYRLAMETRASPLPSLGLREIH